MASARSRFGFFFRTPEGDNSDEFFGSGAPDNIRLLPSETSASPGVFTYRLTEDLVRFQLRGATPGTRYQWKLTSGVPNGIASDVLVSPIGQLSPPAPAADAACPEPR